MASVKTDNGPEGMRNNFEVTAAHLLPYDPVAKKRSNGYKRSSTQISPVMEISDATTRKPNIGKTSVHLHYHKHSEYRTLTQEQKDKLHEWRANNPNIPKTVAKKPRNETSKKPRSFMKKEAASLVETELKRQQNMKPKKIMKNSIPLWVIDPVRINKKIFHRNEHEQIL